MAYYTINKIPVFLSYNKYGEISKLACKDKDHDFF